jgi:hypothetical protein
MSMQATKGSRKLAQEKKKQYFQKLGFITSPRDNALLLYLARSSTLLMVFSVGSIIASLTLF